MDYNFREKPFYLEFPILQISYILLWIPVGYIVSRVIASGLIAIVFNTSAAILYKIFDFAFGLFVMSGRWEASALGFFPYAVIAFDLIFLIIGLELISRFLDKKRLEEKFYEQQTD